MNNYNIMEKYIEKSKDLNVYGSFDVIVVGGGTAGAVAAIAAAREGMTVLIVEQFGALGGLSTLGVVTPVMHSGIKGNPMCSGISDELNNYCLDEGFSFKDGNSNAGYNDPLFLRFAFEELALKAGVKILYHTYFSDVIKEGNILKGIIVENKAGRQAIFGKRICDASGDADVSVMAGVGYEKGNPETGKCQPISLRYIVGGIDIPAFVAFNSEIAGAEMGYKYPIYHNSVTTHDNTPLRPIFEKAVAAGDLDQEDAEYWQVFGIPGRHDGLAFNCPEFFDEVDGTNPDVLSKTQQEGRRRIKRHLNFYKKYFKGFENAYIAEIAEMVGIRESRRIISEYVLTAEDVVKRRKFEDMICQSNYPVDIHGAGSEYLCKILESEDRDPIPFYEIPYLCLVPKGMENLIVAGRCIGNDFISQSSTRVQHSCRAFGEAAGIACAMSIKNDTSFKDIKGKDVRTIMIENGAKFAVK